MRTREMAAVKETGLEREGERKEGKGRTSLDTSRNTVHCSVTSESDVGDVGEEGVDVVGEFVVVEVKTTDGYGKTS
jgi:hypothetical protein